MPNKPDIISGTEEAYTEKLFSVRVSFHAYSNNKKSVGVLVDTIIDERGECTSASRLEWFPLSICELIEEKIDGEFRPRYWIKAPEWILKKKNMKF